MAIHSIRFERFFDRDNLEKTIMPTDRTMLTYELLSRMPYSKAISESYESFGSANKDSRIGIERLIANGIFQAAFPLHDVYRLCISIHLNKKKLKKLLNFNQIVELS